MTRLRNPDRFTDFDRWINAEHGIQPCDGFYIFDVDKVIHRFKTRPCGRKVQCMMFLEIKTRNETLSEAQRDSIFMTHQLITTRLWKFSRDDNGRFDKGHHANIRDAWTWMNRKQHKSIRLICYGYFVLRMSNGTPADSESMWWGVPSAGDFSYHPVTIGQVKSLLSFDIDPVTFRPMDLRRHKIKKIVREPPTLLDVVPSDGIHLFDDRRESNG